uniref:Transmembrane protein n=1 Tax=Syphacia muris TaxID=451379 RepID=A0A0N5AS31_9BILA
MKESFVPLPLPSYNMLRLVKENPWIFTIISTVLTIFLSIFLWRHFGYKQKTHGKHSSTEFMRKCCKIRLFFDFTCAVFVVNGIIFFIGHSQTTLEQGCFNATALKGIRRYTFSDEEVSSSNKDVSSKNMDAYLDYEKLGPLYPKVEESTEDNVSPSSCDLNDNSDGGEATNSSISSKSTSVSDELVKNAGVVDSLKMLHGKLATADINLKARQLEQNMTEEEKKEEALVRRKQLESIFALMAENKERFGDYNEAEIMDQMKLYSFSR